jgi:enoyl reductase-like protein
METTTMTKVLYPAGTTFALKGQKMTYIGNDWYAMQAATGRKWVERFSATGHLFTDNDKRGAKMISVLNDAYMAGYLNNETNFDVTGVANKDELVAAILGVGMGAFRDEIGNISAI